MWLLLLFILIKEEVSIVHNDKIYEDRAASETEQVSDTKKAARGW